jgi:hypothetical protein
MLKALRIASISAVICAVAAVVSVAMLGFKGDPEIEAFLAQEGVVEQFRKKSQSLPVKADNAVSPLEQVAKSFALRLDPPPPPPPPKPIEPPKPPTVKAPSVQPPKLPENKQPTLSAKFTLVATARCPENPAKSMALLQNAQNEYKWYRQGEEIGHLVLQEVRDGSIVLYQNGQFNSELFMPAPPSTPSLLKGDTQVASAPQGPSSMSVTLTQEPREGSTAEGEAEGALKTAAGKSGASRIPSLPNNRSVPTRIASSRAPETPTETVSPEEQARSISESIANIENIMRRPPEEGQTEQERLEEQKTWAELLKLLQLEKENQQKLLSETDSSGKSSNESKPAEPPQAAAKPAEPQQAAEKPAEETKAESSEKTQ